MAAIGRIGGLVKRAKSPRDKFWAADNIWRAVAEWARGLVDSGCYH